MRIIGSVAAIRVVTGCSRMPIASDAPKDNQQRYEWAAKDIRKARTPDDRWLALGEAAKASAWIGRYDEAERYAKELESLAPKYEGDWNYGNAVHDYNTALGYVNLKRGNRKAAVRYLLESGKTPGSPQLNSFGPNMSLANALLIEGEKGAVISYFDLCKEFWPMKKLSDWRKSVAAGEIPDFGANMVY